MRILAGMLIALAGLALPAVTADATPSTTYWTPAVIDFQPPGLTHITYDTYTTLSSKAPGAGGENFPIDYGLTWGAKLGPKINAEYGFDYFAPAKDPLYFNAKVGYAEGALAANAPALEVGIFNAGTRSGVTNQNIVDLITGKTLPNNAGRIHAALYAGNSKVLRSSNGDKQNTGFMLAYDKTLVPNKVVFAADYASGKNAIGGGGFGLYYYFTPNIDLLGGPVWFNDKGINGKTKFTLQLDVNF